MARRANGEGSIHRRKDGRWAGIFRDRKTGRRRSVYANTRTEVAKKLSEALRVNDDGFLQDQPRLRLGPYLIRWLETAVEPSVRRSTLDGYRMVVERHLAPGLGHSLGSNRQTLPTTCAPSAVRD